MFARSGARSSSRSRRSTKPASITSWRRRRLPGQAAAAERSELLREILQRFRSPRGSAPGSGYTWMWLLNARLVDERIVDALPRDRPSYLFHEAQQRLHSTDADGIRGYFAALQPWEDYGVLVFDDSLQSLQWCLAFGEYKYYVAGVL